MDRLFTHPKRLASECTLVEPLDWREQGEKLFHIKYFPAVCSTWKICQTFSSALFCCVSYMLHVPNWSAECPASPQDGLAVLARQRLNLCIQMNVQTWSRHEPSYYVQHFHTNFGFREIGQHIRLDCIVLCGGTSMFCLSHPCQSKTHSRMFS